MTCWSISEVRALTLGPEAQCVPVRGLGFLVENNSQSASVYLREQRYDGIPADAQNGWVLLPGERLSLPLTALDLSLSASAEGTDVRVLILDTV